MRILTLTYPLTAVAENACGGTEQIAYELLRRLEGRPDMELLRMGASGAPAESYTPAALAELERRSNDAALRYLEHHPVDLIHNQGAGFYAVAAQAPAPVLFTLHLARALYPPGFLAHRPANLHVQCVSQTQRAEYGDTVCCGTIANGIALERFPARREPAAADAPLLYLGRICAEKGPHLAIEMARRARRRLWLVGAVAPFPDHQAYFRRRIVPHLNADIRWMAPPEASVKRALLAACAAVVIPSLVAETSSLAAMEAAASGVPALALRVGALPETIAPGESGWLADSWEELAEAVQRLDEIAPATCRARAERRFCSRRMAREYEELYRRLAHPAGMALAA